MVDLHRQYLGIRDEVDRAIGDVIAETAFISSGRNTASVCGPVLTVPRRCTGRWAQWSRAWCGSAFRTRTPKPRCSAP